jgi:hypothetical protein
MPPHIDSVTHIVQKQIHRHTHTCFKAGRYTCRFKYPKPLSEETRLTRPTDSRRGLRRCDFYVTKRREGGESVVPYSPLMLVKWRANMDIQMIGNCYATNAYVSGYISKAETAGLNEHIQRETERLPEGCSLRTVLTRVGTACLSHRQVSLQEQAYLLCGLPLREKSREVESLSVAKPEKRNRLVDTAALRDIENQNARCPFKFTKYDFYRHRPPEYEDLTIVQFTR